MYYSFHSMCMAILMILSSQPENMANGDVCPKATAKYTPLLEKRDCQFGAGFHPTEKDRLDIETICHSKDGCSDISNQDFSAACKAEVGKRPILVSSSSCRRFNSKKIKTCPITAEQHAKLRQQNAVLDVAIYEEDRIQFFFRFQDAKCQKQEKLQDEIMKSCTKFYTGQSKSIKTSFSCSGSTDTVLFRMKYPDPVKPKLTQAPTARPTNGAQSASQCVALAFGTVALFAGIFV